MTAPFARPGQPRGSQPPGAMGAMGSTHPLPPSDTDHPSHHLLSIPPSGGCWDTEAGGQQACSFLVLDHLSWDGMKCQDPVPSLPITGRIPVHLCIHYLSPPGEQGLQSLFSVCPVPRTISDTYPLRAYEIFEKRMGQRKGAHSRKVSTAPINF